MIKKRTVLILGAGASVDYGFPTGRKLLLEICNGAVKGGRLYAFLLDTMPIKEQVIQDFRDALWKSQAPSVDLFLENRQEFLELGKMAIAASLIPRESYTGFERSAELGWYEFLFSLMIEGGRFEDNPLSVITFNYDRSLEAFFLLALCNLRGHEPSAAEKIVAKIPVIHIYGSLGGRTWSPDPASDRGYSPELRAEWVREAAGRIRIMHEVKEEEMGRVVIMISKAEEVIFLGFGFHAENIKQLYLDRLTENPLQGNPQWFASRYGMGDGDIARAQELLLPIGQLRFGNNERATITEFLKAMPCLM